MNINWSSGIFAYLSHINDYIELDVVCHNSFLKTPLALFYVIAHSSYRSNDNFLKMVFNKIKWFRFNLPVLMLGHS